MSLPPPPTFRAPTRESIVLQKGTSSPPLPVPMEEDLSFMDPEIKRLHQNVASILAAASTPPPASRDWNHFSGSATLPATRGDSDDDCADDEPALAVLGDNLRSTTEKFFERISPRTDGSQRRASALVPGRARLSKDATQGALPLGLRHEQFLWHQSWNGLADFEKGVGGMIRRPERSVSTPSRKSRGPENGHPASHGARAEYDQLGEVGVREMPRAICGKGNELTTRTKTTRDRRGAPRPPIDHDGNPIRLQDDAREGKRITENRQHTSSAEQPCRMHGQSSSESKAVLQGLRARSDEATRTLTALKKLIGEESKDTATRSNDGSRVVQRRLQPDKLKTRTEDPSSYVTGESNSASNRVPQLLRAMENLQQINAELSAELAKASASGKDARACFRRRKSSSLFLSRTPGARPRQRPRFFSRAMVQSSSDLLARRRSEIGQAEPMSCGVPRYRMQVTKRGNDTVYFELAITQSKSTWTLERRIDEFLDLRRSLVKTASDFAKAEAKKAGYDGGAYTPVDFRRVGEARVPELNVRKTSWLEKTPLRSMLFRRSREEMLAEKQVLLASWLANVLADSTLMSTDLVRFLGGDVAAQPVVEDAGGADVHSTEAPELWNTSGSDSSGEGYSSRDDDDEGDEEDDQENLECAGVDARVSSYPPQECVPTKDQCERLERDTIKRVALIRDDSPTFPEDSPIISLGRGSPPNKVARRGGGVYVVECSDAKVANRCWGEEVDEDEDEYEEEDENVGDKPVIPEPTVPPSFTASGHWSDDSAMRGPRGPSPSSPTRNTKLDAFFLAPT